jgi:sugar-specific transcriptional regulator TrmB
MNLTQELRKFGLTANEVKVYLACLELAPESVQNISRKAKLNRVTVYGLIEGLTQKGFLREEQVKNKRKISAYSPVKLYDIVTHREDEVKRQVVQLETLVPELKKRAKAAQTKTNIIYYEGEEGLKNWASDALETKGELLEWAKIESFSKRFDKYLQTYYFLEKARRKIPTRFIFIDTREAREYVKVNYVDRPGAPPMKARFISRELFDTPGYMLVFNDRFSLALPKEMRAVTVIDPIIADAQKKIWEFGWAYAKNEVENKPYPKSK